MEKILNDELLIERFRQGDQKAFAAIFDLYYLDISYFAAKMLSDIEQGKDIASETMTKLWRRHNNFENIPNIKAFLYITARNACLDFLRSKRRHKIEMEFTENELESEDFYQVQQIELDLMKRIELAVESLPEKQRMVFKLCFTENLSSEEIASRMNITVSTVRTTKKQVVDKLRNSFFDLKGSLGCTLLLLLFHD